MKYHGFVNQIFIYCCLFGVISSASAGEFNFGLGYIGLNVNHYRGSDQTKVFNLYVPYVYYKGDTVEADGALINTRFINTRFFSMKLSLGANPSVESDSNTARVGMPELNYNFGLGPMALLHIIRTPSFSLQIEANIKKEFETDFKLTRAFGVTNTTYLTFKLKQETWSSELAFGQIFGDKDFHAYYYNVDPEFVTAKRPEYIARGGESGKIIVFTIKKRFGNLLIYPFVRYENLEDTVFEDSPLVKQDDYMLYGVGLFYLLF